ncbi:unnamed protein product [Cladocopium goreaui]|uniref:Peptidylprolyl isomerase n=1 Tax=Cladocopium goreaui TaxID=2562237 RepID=A0A9P1BHX8_9DINO|nr:unnamed protein product [Cladocopium goreaui]
MHETPRSAESTPGLKLGSPSKGLLNEALDNEDQLRAAFYRYTHGQLYLSRSQMPAVLKDLGITIPSADACQLDKDFFQTFCDHEFNSADENKDGKVSFQECIAYQNRYLSMMQARRALSRLAMSSRNCMPSGVSDSSNEWAAAWLSAMRDPGRAFAFPR